MQRVGDELFSLDVVDVLDLGFVRGVEEGNVEVELGAKALGVPDYLLLGEIFVAGDEVAFPERIDLSKIIQILSDVFPGESTKCMIKLIHNST